MKRVGVIDIGTNSVKLLVASANGRGARVERERVVITRLGEGAGARGRLTAAAMDRTVRTISALVREARRLGVERPVAVGTAALRAAVNRDAFLRRLRLSSGLETRILSGRSEARLSFEGATGGLAPPARFVVVDVGGGSTEIAWTTDGRCRFVSVSLGAVRLSERYLRSDPIRAREFRSLLGTIRATTRRALRDARQPPARVIAVGGTAATLAAMQWGLRSFGPRDIHGRRLTRSQLYVWLIVLSLLPFRQRLELPGLEPRRADIIVAGAAVLAGVLSALRAPGLTVSARGLRHGVAQELLRPARL